MNDTDTILSLMREDEGDAFRLLFEAYYAPLITRQVYLSRV
jgi:hypothetical protein